MRVDSRQVVVGCRVPDVVQGFFADVVVGEKVEDLLDQLNALAAGHVVLESEDAGLVTDVNGNIWIPGVGIFDIDIICGELDGSEGLAQQGLGVDPSKVDIAFLEPEVDRSEKLREISLFFCLARGG